MSEEEKKAIDIIKYNDIARPLACGDITICNIEDLKIALNLIQKQQEEIERLNNLNNHQSKEIGKAVDYTFELNTELEKKDKIIEELEDIFYNYQLCEYELTDCIFRKCEYISDDETPPCKECIKEYFKRKVEGIK